MEKPKVIRKIKGYPVIKDDACVAGYRTGYVLEDGEEDTIVMSKYYYDDSNNVCCERVAQFTAEEWLFMTTNYSNKRILEKVRETAGCSFAIREQVAFVL